MKRLLLADRVKGREDSFLVPLIPALARVYDIRFISEGPGASLAEAIAWADIVWLEWCWDHAVWATNSGVLGARPCVLRLHSIEALQTDFPARVDWSHVDCLMMVGEDIADILPRVCPAAAVAPRRVIANGIDLSRFRPTRAETPGSRFNIGWVGHIEPKKNPMLLPQIAHRLRQIDARYRIHVAGPFTDVRTHRYLDRVIGALELAETFVFHGHVADMPAWYGDKGVLLSTTMYESFGLNIGEAMACGAFPVIHDFPGADRLWPLECLFASIDQAVALIRAARTGLYRDWVAERYGLDQQAKAVLSMLDQIAAAAPSLA